MKSFTLPGYRYRNFSDFKKLEVYFDNLEESLKAAAWAELDSLVRAKYLAYGLTSPV